MYKQQTSCCKRTDLGERADGGVGQMRLKGGQVKGKEEGKAERGVIKVQSASKGRTDPGPQKRQMKRQEAKGR